MQATPQHAQVPIPPDTYGVNTGPASRRHYQQQSPQPGDPRPSYTGGSATSSPQATRYSSRKPSGAGPPTSSATSSSPMAPSKDTSSNQRRQREQLDLQEQQGGPRMAPPPRTSSNQGGQNTNLSSTTLPDRTVPARQASRTADDGSSSSRAVNSIDRREAGDREGFQGGGIATMGERERLRDDTSTAAAAAARSRRRVPTSPEGHQSKAGSRGTRNQQSPAATRSRSAANVPTPPALSREDSEIINRVIVTDPQIDLDRERERLAEAVPVNAGTDAASSTGLGLVDSEGVDDGGRGGGRSRQDYSASAARRKETKFGEYILGQTLGEGEFGKVKLGWKKDGSVQVAIKLIRRESLGSNPSRLPKIYREISILRELSHPNIVRLHEMVETDRHIGIILEYASGGELFDYILNHRYLKDNAARRLFAQLVSGVGYLHKKGIVHRDLKLENLLLDRNRNIIITDFGFANTFDPQDELTDEIEYGLTNRDFVKRLDLERIQDGGSRRGDLMQTSCGSPCYAAPELVVTDSLYTGRKVDVWSCGVILYAMLAGYLPFDDDPANPEGDNINLLYKYIVSTPLTFPEYVTPHARDLLRRILVPDPRKRADLFEIARHSWLSEYAHVVSHVTSSTTTVGEIANTTVTTEDQQDAPLLARSASVREPAKPYPVNLSPVGGLSHQGKIDLEQSDEKPKTQRDAKRRTVQVEYVPPQSQTVRGETSPPVGSSAVTGPPLTTTGGQSRSRARNGSQGPVAAARQVDVPVSTTKPLPQEPTNVQDSRLDDAYVAPLGSNKPQQRSTGNQQSMPPPARAGREVPRSASESTGAFGQVTTSIAARPTTGGSMASAVGGRLQSRGNSYSQPLAPTVAATNAQGKVTQPKTGKQYNISAPIPQQEPYMMDISVGHPSIQQSTNYDGRPSTTASTDPARGHKRSNTLGNVFSRSGSLFGSRPQPQSPRQEPRQQTDKRYPPTSMKNPIASNSPRPSTDSRRSTSFGFGRKSSKNSDLGKQDKQRRFSLLPSSFSFKALTGSARDLSTDSGRPPLDQRQSTASSQAPRPRAQSKVQFAFGRGASRANSYDTEDSDEMGLDGLRDRTREASAQQAKRVNVPARHPPHSAPAQQSHFDNPQSSSQQEAYSSRPPAKGKSYLLSESAPPTPSETSLPAPHRRPQYPPGFNDYDEEPRPSMQQGRNVRGPGVLSKNNRRFAEAYEQEKVGYGAGGQHAGSSGAAKKVMDFFRRRGKARAGDDR
ncbi:serine threonine protein kinase [Lasallia pustulata]|uniref:non-specific serine/threonine protein kinase n=1 Tax=Lasallia pustulata TaxID=136370 RepID=A0A1W5CZI2_9LECA|nr:serine threonine protein kinase [Lasallia pustulata]